MTQLRALKPTRTRPFQASGGRSLVTRITAPIRTRYGDRARFPPKTSASAVAEIVKLLKADSRLKVYVVGHTDTVGNLDANLALSKARAEAVVQALVRDGVAAARLKSFGNGPFAPVASNATDEGKARNRRVELVKQ